MCKPQILVYKLFFWLKSVPVMLVMVIIKLFCFLNFIFVVSIFLPSKNFIFNRKIPKPRILNLSGSGLLDSLEASSRLWWEYKIIGDW